MNSQQIDSFLSNFRNQKLAIETESSRLIQSAESDLKSGLNSDFTRDLDKLIESYHELELELNQLIPSLPSYHVKSLTGQLKSLSDGIESAKDVVVPKKKFSFGRRGKAASSSASKGVKSPPEDTPVNEEEKEKEEEEDENSVRIRNKRNDQNVSVPRCEIESKVIVIESVIGCSINLPGNPSAVYVKKMKDSILNVGPTSTSVFLSDTINCTLNACAQQVRIHDSTSCILRLKVTGGTILENCSNIRVGRYNYSYPELDTDLAKVHMVDEKKNKWDQIVDFNWLSGDAKSPNWDFLEED